MLDHERARYLAIEHDARSKVAVGDTSEALHVARQIDKVSEQMDVLIEHVAADQPDLPGHGKHAKPDLQALPGGAERYIA